MCKHKNIIMGVLILVLAFLAIIFAKKKIDTLEFKSFPSEEIKKMSKMKLNFYRLNNMLAFKGYKELFKKDTYRMFAEAEESINFAIFSVQYITHFVVLSTDSSEVF